MTRIGAAARGAGATPAKTKATSIAILTVSRIWSSASRIVPACRRSILSLRRDLRPQTLLLLLQLGRERVAEVLRFEHLADFDLGAAAERRALQPLDRVLLRLHLPQPEAGNELLRFGEGAIGHGPLAVLEL